MNNITTLVRQLESMQERLSDLCLQASGSIMPLEVLPLALKELGPTAEALQMASESLQQRRSHDEAQARFGCTSQAQLITTVEGKIQAANSAAVQLLRLSESDLVGQAVNRFMAIDQQSRLQLHLNRLRQTLLPQEWLSDLQPHRGKPLELVFSIAPLPQPDDQPMQIHWTLQNAATLRALLIDSPLKGEPVGQPTVRSLPTELSNFAQHQFEKGDVIPLSLQNLWVVQRGIVRLSTITADNEEIVLGWVGTGMPFSASSAVLLTYQATALTTVRLAKIPLSEMYTQSDLAQALLAKFQHRLQQAESLLNISGQRRTEDRMYALLHFLKCEFGESIETGEIRLSIRLTHENLANACCTTRVTVTRLMSKFNQMGKLRFDRKNHIILNEKF